MNNSLNEYLRFNFELNIELNHFLARFNVKMNNQNVSLTPRLGWVGEVTLYNIKIQLGSFLTAVPFLPVASEWIGQNVPRFGMSGMCLGVA